MHAQKPTLNLICMCMHACILQVPVDLRSATQKSWRGLGSEARE